MQNKISKEFLIEHYVNQKKSARTICKELNIKSKTIILRLLKKYNIKPHKDRTGIKQPNAIKHGELHRSYMYIIESRAKRLGYEYDLDGDYLWDLFCKQNKKCAISGLDIKMPKTWGYHTKTEMTASLDRIDSNKGYVKNNVWWVHKQVNRLKGDMELHEFIKLCKLIGNYPIQ